jgi:hypothetical protein
MSKPWVFFTELRYSGPWGCVEFVNPDNFEVSPNGKSVAFDVNCDDGRGYDHYHVTVDAPDAGPFSLPAFSFWGGFRVGIPGFKFVYTQRVWGVGKVRVCGVGGDGHCFERPAGGHGGGQIVARSESMTVVEWPSVFDMLL